MKIRMGFVSNSSSSSFVVIDTTGNYCDIPLQLSKKELLVGRNLGETEFGWGQEVLYDCGSRINFAYIQATYMNNQEWLQMLEEVIKKNSKVETIKMLISEDYDSDNWGYIDHQSSALEGVNTEMFVDKMELKYFLFGEKSKIVLDNDNH